MGHGGSPCLKSRTLELVTAGMIAQLLTSDILCKKLCGYHGEVLIRWDQHILTIEGGARLEEPIEAAS